MKSLRTEEILQMIDYEFEKSTMEVLQEVGTDEIWGKDGLYRSL